MASRSTFFLINGFLKVRARTDIPLRAAWRRLMIAFSSGPKKTERRAEDAWWHGDAPAAIVHWRALERVQPTVAEWPLMISRATRERGEFETAERTLRDARIRGIEDEAVELALLRLERMNRRSNSAIPDAEAIVADPAASPNKIFDACFYLMAHNRLDQARAGYERIASQPAYKVLARGHLAVIDLLSRARASGRPDVPAWVSPAESSTLVREPASDTLVVCFALPAGSLGLSLNALHAMLSSKGVNALYLYDSRQVLHLAGTDRFGPGYQAMLDGIRAVARELGVRRLITVGGSATGYTAIRTALDLDADGALVFGAQTFMTPNASFALARSAHTLTKMIEHIRPMMKNLRPLIEAKAHAPRIEIFFSAQNRRDRMHAGNIAGLPGVTLHPIEGIERHDCLTEMAHRGHHDLLDLFAAK